MWPFSAGDIQIGMVHRKERLDVEVIRARGLVGKPGNKQTPGMSHHDTMHIFFLFLDYLVRFLCKSLWSIICSTLRKSISAGQREVHQQKENTDSEKNTGSSLSTAASV